MKFASIALPAALAAVALAAPSPKDREASKASKPYPPITTPTATGSDSIFTAVPIYDCCISHKQAAAIVSAFQWLLANPTSPAFANTATALFSNSFNDYSDSINFITGQALGSATFNSTQAFITGSGGQPPLIVTTLGYFAGCQEIAWRWQSTSGVGSDADPVKGIDTFYLHPSGKIDTVYAEFNSAAFLLDLGNPQCSNSTS